LQAGSTTIPEFAHGDKFGASGAVGGTLVLKELLEVEIGCAGWAVIDEFHHGGLDFGQALGG
jgi:hypothetical protein